MGFDLTLAGWCRSLCGVLLEDMLLLKYTIYSTLKFGKNQSKHLWSFWVLPFGRGAKSVTETFCNMSKYLKISSQINSLLGLCAGCLLAKLDLHLFISIQVAFLHYQSLQVFLESCCTTAQLCDIYEVFFRKSDLWEQQIEDLRDICLGIE